MKDEPADVSRVWTIGHSTRPLDEFIAVLRAHRVRALADVRRFPASRRHAQFNADTLAEGLAQAGIAYLPFSELGGRRKPRPDSRNTAWRNESFRGYADYMETPQFAAAMERLVEAARAAPTAIMCAELLWWRCHRALIADCLKASGMEVINITDAAHAQLHPYTAPARLVRGRLSYAGTENLF